VVIAVDAAVDMMVLRTVAEGIVDLDRSENSSMPKWCAI